MNRDVLSIILFAEIPQLFGKKKYNIVDKKIYLLTKREGWTGKYLKQGYAVQITYHSRHCLTQFFSVFALCSSLLCSTSPSPFGLRKSFTKSFVYS